MTGEAQGPQGKGHLGRRPRRCGLLSKFCDDLLCNDTAVQRYIRSTFSQSVTRLQTSVRQAVTSALNSLQQTQAARLRVSSKSINKFESNTHTHTHTRLTARFSGTARVGRYHYQKGKTNLDFTEAGDSEWQWHQLGYMQVCTSLQTDNHASTSPLSFLQAGCPSINQSINPAAQPTTSKH